jgi:hypothetical protein
VNISALHFITDKKGGRIYPTASEEPFFATAADNPKSLKSL